MGEIPGPARVQIQEHGRHPREVKTITLMKIIMLRGVFLRWERMMLQA
jgi:hypothetical protein